MTRQLSQQQIKDTIDVIKETQYVRSMKSHPWVTEDGVYEHEEHSLRLFMWNGFAYYSASRMWVEDQVQNKRLPEWMREPWGTYPTLPAKPPKK